MTTILIADDHSIVRFGLSRLINGLPIPVQITEAKTFDEVILHMEEQSFNLIILDINLPGGNSLRMLHAIRLRLPEVKILIFSGYDEQLYAIDYLKAGANGYLEKKYAVEEEMVFAITTVLKNEVYMSPATRQQLIGQTINERQPEINPFTSLSSRETEVMHLLVKGMMVTKIAENLHLQMTTVSTYKTRIFEKLGVSNVVELADKVKRYNASI